MPALLVNGYRLRVQITLWSRSEDIPACPSTVSPGLAPLPEQLVRSRERWSESHRNEVTEILPLDGFGDLDDLYEIDELASSVDFEACSFDNAEQVLLAPELDDLHEIDNLAPVWLAAAPTDVLARVTMPESPDMQPELRHWF